MVDDEDITSCVFWSDNAGHFHNQMLMHYCLAELVYDPAEGIFDNVVYKFFAANHGKSPCDSHFGKISYYYKLYTSTQESGIHTSQDLCDMIQNMMAERHKQRMDKMDKMKKKPKNYEKEKLLQFYAVNFDIKEVIELREAHTNQLELQYRITIPDIKSFGYFESRRDESMIPAYEDMKRDLKYHIRYQLGSGTGYRLRLRREILKLHRRETIKYNLNRAHYRHSGHMIELMLNDNPSSKPIGAIKTTYHYSVDVIPKPVEITKNHVEERAVDVKELVRSKDARDKVRAKLARKMPRRK